MLKKNKYVLLFFALVLSISLKAQNKIVTIKNDTVSFVYKIKYKSSKRIIIKVSKENLLSDTITTYGFINRNIKYKKYTEVNINHLIKDSVLDFVMSWKKTYFGNENVFIDHIPKPPIITMAPKEKYISKVVLKNLEAEELTKWSEKFKRSKEKITPFEYHDKYWVEKDGKRINEKTIKIPVLPVIKY